MQRVFFDRPKHPNGGCIFDEISDCRHVFAPPMHANGGCVFDNPAVFGTIDGTGSRPLGGGGSAARPLGDRTPYGRVILPEPRPDTSIEDDVLVITMLLAVYFEDE